MSVLNNSTSDISITFRETIERLESKIDILETKIDKVANLLDQIIHQNENLNTNLNSINRSTQNMDHHINFVENVFDVVKHPFSSLLRLYYGNKTNEIKDILDIPLPKTSLDGKLDLN